MHPVEDLHVRLTHPQKPVAIVVGSALSITRGIPTMGVPDVEGMIQRIRARLASRGLVERFDRVLAKASDSDRYQAAFEFVRGNLGPEVVNEVIHDAVLEARLPGVPIPFADDGEPCHWHLARSSPPISIR